MPAAYRVIILPEASADLTRIYEHILPDSPQNAAQVVAELLDAADSLDQFPGRYRVHRSYRDPNRVVRAMPVPPFIIYYRVRQVDQVVEVMTIRHGARRQPRRFP